MFKYSFHELREKIQKRLLKILPIDINKPVLDMLYNKLKCPEAAKFIEKFQSELDCGNVQIFDKLQPKHIKITTNFGMVEGYDLAETVETDRYIVTASKHIKNDNLDMKKKDQVQNGR